LSENGQRVLRTAIKPGESDGVWDFDELKIEFEELILADAPIEVSGSPPTRRATRKRFAFPF
jgi:hypothetical protein